MKREFLMTIHIIDKEAGDEDLDEASYSDIYSDVLSNDLMAGLSVSIQEIKEIQPQS